jgi:enoyl-CoA hydratase/carnithine racemase
MLRAEDHGRVRLITLDRPEALNAFNTALYDTTANALAAAAADDGVAVVVITGAGRAFSAGQDLLEMADLAIRFGEGGDDSPATEPGEPASDAPSATSGFPHLLDELQCFPKPLMAAVNGLGLGIGFTMLAHCDLVLIAEGARLKTPFTSLGVSPEAASSYLFPVRMGWQAAARVLFTSDWISAEEAVELGIAGQVCAPEALLDEALALAGRIARMPISSLVTTKRLMLDAQLPLIERARAREEAAFVTVMGGPANLEALSAFAEKREPDFAGVDDRPPAGRPEP